MSDVILHDLLLAMNTVVMERLEGDKFRVISPAPNWFVPLCDRPTPEHVSIHPGIGSSFLAHFLEEAKDFWATHQHGELRSGPWSERTAEGKTGSLEAMAFALGTTHILTITKHGTELRERRAMLQRARDNQLVFERLERAQRALQLSERKNHELIAQLEAQQANLVAVLNQLRVGTVLLDPENLILLINRSCQRIVGREEGQLLGHDWRRVLPFPETTKTALQAMLKRPAEERRRISTGLELPDRRNYWMEIDVQDDPLYSDRHVVFLYDISEVQDLRRVIEERGDTVGMLGECQAMLRVSREISELGRLDTTVLIEGETGTGKELVARELHAVSNRNGKPFVAVNCAGLSESLLSSQLFGHKKGSFTGAVADQKGLFEAAQGGTLFLDEIGDMPPAVQASLLRVLQEKEITRVGETAPRRIDVRIVAATHQDLRKEVSSERFRSDLLYRIQVARIQLPPLREREDDLSILSRSFLREFREAINKPVLSFSPDAWRRLTAHHWPGNVRELRSVVEFAVIRCRGATIQAEDLPPEIDHCSGPTLSHQTQQTQDIFHFPVDEKERLKSALNRTGGNRTAAARLLGISRATFYRRLADHGIS